MSLLEIPLIKNVFSTDVVVYNPEYLKTNDEITLCLNGTPPVSIPKIETKAIIDTGATNTFISERIDRYLKLTKMFKSGYKLADGIPRNSHLSWTMISFPKTYIVLMNVGVLEVLDDDEILVGMDLLKNKRFTYEPRFCKTVDGKLKIDFSSPV